MAVIIGHPLSRDRWKAGSSVIPANAMLFEDGTPMLFDDGQFMVFEA